MNEKSLVIKLYLHIIYKGNMIEFRLNFLSQISPPIQFIYLFSRVFLKVTSPTKGDIIVFFKTKAFAKGSNKIYFSIRLNIDVINFDKSLSLIQCFIYGYICIQA